MSLTPVQNLYDAFLVLIESDEWDLWEQTSMNLDLNQLALAAIPWFKFPRCSLKWDDNQEYFIDEKITNNEIQIIALFMKIKWYGRIIDSLENTRPYYTEVDFSPGKMLSELRQRQESIDKEAKNLERIYYRSVDGKPYDYTKLSGG